MTLVLSLATGTMVLHVGDRLLTASGSPWDPLANKSVVFLGSDGWACVSYSGLACVDSKPTDQWLAETLSDQRVGPPLRPGGGPPIGFIGNFVPCLGQAFARLRAAIERDFTRQPRSERSLGMHIEVTGFIIHRRRKPCARARPFMLRYSHTGRDDSQLEQYDLPRYWEWWRQIQVGSVGVDAGDAKRDALARLGSASNKNEDDCEQILADCVRAVSRNDSKVGAHCMSIVLSRWGDARVRYLPDPANDAGQAAYTPWILAPGTMAPPLALTGPLPQLTAGPFRVEFDRLPPLPPSLPATRGVSRGNASRNRGRDYESRRYVVRLMQRAQRLVHLRAP